MSISLTKITGFLLFIQILATSCTSTETAVVTEVTDKPEWLNQMPNEEDFYYAVGIGTDTDEARQKALVALGQQFSVHVNSAVIEQVTTTNSKTEATVNSISEQVTDYVVYGAKFVDQFEEPGQISILARAPLDCMLDITEGLLLSYSLDLKQDAKQIQQMMKTIAEESEKDAGRFISHLNDPGLIAYYPLDGNARDSSGQGNHGSLYEVDSSSFNGRLAMGFDRESDYIEIPKEVLSDLPEGTFACWIYADGSQNQTEYYDIFYKETYDSETISGLRINNDWTVQGTHNNYDKNGSGSDATDVKTSTPISPDNWHFIVWTWDGRSQKIYLDGILDQTKQNRDGISQDQGDYVRLGAGDERFFGYMDDIYIYDYAISATTISQIYENSK